jgi:hypothetical protein
MKKANENNYSVIRILQDDVYPLTGFEFLKKSKTVMRIAVKN